MNLLSSFPFLASSQARPDTATGLENKGTKDTGGFLRALMQVPAGPAEVIESSNSKALVMPGDAGKVLPPAGKALPLAGNVSVSSDVIERPPESTDLNSPQSAGDELPEVPRQQERLPGFFGAVRSEAFTRNNDSETLPPDTFDRGSLRQGLSTLLVNPADTAAVGDRLPPTDRQLPKPAHAEAVRVSATEIDLPVDKQFSTEPASLLQADENRTAVVSTAVIAAVREVEISAGKNRPTGTSIDDFPANPAIARVLPGDAREKAHAAAATAHRPSVRTSEIPVLRRKVAVATSLQVSGSQLPGNKVNSTAARPDLAGPKIAAPSHVQGATGRPAADLTATFPEASLSKGQSVSNTAGQTGNLVGALPGKAGHPAAELLGPPERGKEGHPATELQGPPERKSENARLDVRSDGGAQLKHFSGRDSLASRHEGNDQRATSLQAHEAQLENKIAQRHDLFSRANHHNPGKPGANALTSASARQASDASRAPNLNLSAPTSSMTPDAISPTPVADVRLPAGAPASDSAVAASAAVRVSEARVVSGRHERPNAETSGTSGKISADTVLPKTAQETMSSKPVTPASAGLADVAVADDVNASSAKRETAAAPRPAAGMLIDNGNRIESVRVAGAEVVNGASPFSGQVNVTDATVPTYSLRAAMGSEQWAQSLGERVILMVRGEQQLARLSLNPEHLGPVEIRLQVKDDQAQLWIHAQHQQARDAIDTALPRLREMLAEQGLNLGRDGARDGHSEQGNRSNAQRGPQGGQWERHAGDENLAEDRRQRHGHDGMIDHYA